MLLSWFKVKFMMYVDSNSFYALGNTTKLNDLFLLICQWKVTAKEFFYCCRLFFAKFNFTKDELLLQMFFKFLTGSVDQSLLDDYFYLLLSLKLFSQKKSVLLKLPHLINYSLIETGSVQRNPFCHFLVGTHY